MRFVKLLEDWTTGNRPVEIPPQFSVGLRQKLLWAACTRWGSIRWIPSHQDGSDLGMTRTRKLMVVADDFGIGPETDRGILAVAEAGRLTATVLLVNTDYTESALRAWNQAGQPMAVGWHPNLTLDRPILPAEQLPSLVQPDGRFYPLGKFLLRALTGRLNPHEVAAELAAQHRRFTQLLGHPPRVVNSHQHVAIFPPVRQALIQLLASQPGPKPYLRRVTEQYKLLLQIRGARIKRSVLNWYGRGQRRLAIEHGLPGSDCLVGVTDPPITQDPRFYTRWLEKVGGHTVEVGCHPGYRDETLLVRDVPGNPHDLERRVYELNMLLSPEFLTAVDRAGFELISAQQFQPQVLAHAA
jgi:predicted glycoside hydrolase/deacetylase ChbG (UPF0249 family)